MPIAWIDTPSASVHLRSESISIKTPGVSPAKLIPIAEIDRLILCERAQITTQATCALIRRQVPIYYVDHHDHTVGSTIAPVLPDTATRLKQYQKTIDSEFRLQVAQTLIHAKIFNQRKVVQKLNSNRPGKIQAKVIDQLIRYGEQAKLAKSLPSLRGIEGSSTRVYYDLWSKFLPEELPFVRRSTRPPKNPVNACLSYASVLVYHEMVDAIRRGGLDPGLGLLHETENRRWSLALDFMEPFRPALAEALTMHLFGHRILTLTEFEERDRGVFLNAKGKRLFLQHYGKRIVRRFWYRPLGERTCFRRTMDLQVKNFKKALEKPKVFQPFLLK